MDINKNMIFLFSGDSITDGNRVHKMDLNHIMGHGYQFIIAAKLAFENAEKAPKFINKGYSGATMPELYEKWKTDVVDNNPDVLSILAGINDGHFGYLRGFTVDETVKRYEESLENAVADAKEKNNDIKIIICEPFYFPMTEEDYFVRIIPHPECEEKMIHFGFESCSAHINYQIEATEKIRFAAKRIAEENRCMFLPLQDKFKEKIKETGMAYFIWDGTHPTVAGHMLIAQEWLKLVFG